MVAIESGQILGKLNAAAAAISFAAGLRTGVAGAFDSLCKVLPIGAQSYVRAKLGRGEAVAKQAAIVAALDLATESCLAVRADLQAVDSAVEKLRKAYPSGPLTKKDWAAVDKARAELRSHWLEAVR